jgi:uncharacterized protein (DUF2267 family)
MDELINIVAQKTGLAPDKARTAVDTVLGFMKDRLPAPIASQLEAALSGKGADVGDLTKGISGMMG